MGYDVVFMRGLQRQAARASELDEWYPAELSRSLEVIAPTERCRRAWYLSKPHYGLHLVLPGGELPGDVAAFGRAPLALTEHVRTVAHEVESLGYPPLGYVGDLDPWDLLAFHVLRIGGIAGDASDAPPLAIDWLGVDDRWLALCEAHPRTPSHPSPSTITLTGFERGHLAWLDDLADWDALVGPRSMALLRSGHKLELEGASNPGFYGPGFAAALRVHLARLGATRRR